MTTLLLLLLLLLRYFQPGYYPSKFTSYT